MRDPPVSVGGARLDELDCAERGVYEPWPRKGSDRRPDARPCASPEATTGLTSLSLCIRLCEPSACVDTLGPDAVFGTTIGAMFFLTLSFFLLPPIGVPPCPRFDFPRFSFPKNWYSIGDSPPAADAFPFLLLLFLRS